MIGTFYLKRTTFIWFSQLEFYTSSLAQVVGISCWNLLVQITNFLHLSGQDFLFLLKQILNFIINIVFDRKQI